MKVGVYLNIKDTRCEEFEKTILLGGSVIKRLAQKCKEMPLSEILSEIKITRNLIVTQQLKVGEI